jgi:hypothetical protein
VYTPATEHSGFPLCRSKSFEKRSFGASLKLLLEDDSNFKDWVGDAKKAMPSIPPMPPILSLPDTPVANVEIRLVEPTPVPSRVGSLGGGSVMGGLLSVAAVPPRLNEEEEEGEIVEEHEPITIKARGKRTGKFFLHSSPTKESGSDSATSPVTAPTTTAEMQRTSSSQSDVKSSPRRPYRRSSASDRSPKADSRHHRKSSNSSERAKKGRVTIVQDAERPPKRNISLSTMRGKFRAENRRAAEELASKDNSGESGWEDENDDAWEEGEAEEGEADDGEVDEGQDAIEEKESEKGDEGDWSDEPGTEEASPEKERRPSKRSGSDLDLQHLLRSNSRKTVAKAAPPPPAPTPLRQMSKRERLAAKAERDRIEAELDAQRKREMFAKQQIFGKPVGAATGLLTGMFKTGGSMVDLVGRIDSKAPMQG